MTPGRTIRITAELPLAGPDDLGRLARWREQHAADLTTTHRGRDRIALVAIFWAERTPAGWADPDVAVVHALAVWRQDLIAVGWAPGDVVDFGLFGPDVADESPGVTVEKPARAKVLEGLPR